jgi:hypothetical protein
VSPHHCYRALHRLLSCCTLGAAVSSTPPSSEKGCA